MKKSMISVFFVALLFIASGCTKQGDAYKVASTMNTEAFTAIVVDRDVKQNLGMLDNQSVIDTYREASTNLDDVYESLGDEEVDEGLDYVLAALGYYYESMYQMLKSDANFEAVYLGDDSDKNSISGVSVLKLSEASSIESDLVDALNEIASENVGMAVYVEGNYMVIVNTEYIIDVDAFLALAQKGVASVTKK